MADGHMIMFGDVPEHIRHPSENNLKVEDYNPEITLFELEKRYILKALRHFSGNKTRAASALGITIKTLYNKLHMYGEFENFAVQKPEGEI
jgi:two-component system response regulator HydG